VIYLQGMYSIDLLVPLTQIASLILVIIYDFYIFLNLEQVLTATGRMGSR